MHQLHPPLRPPMLLTTDKTDSGLQQEGVTSHTHRRQKYIFDIFSEKPYEIEEDWVHRGCLLNCPIGSSHLHLAEIPDGSTSYLFTLQLSISNLIISYQHLYVSEIGPNILF